MLRKVNPRILELLLCSLSGILLALSFSSFNLGILAWIAFVPLFFALNNKNKHKRLQLGLFTGIIFWACTIYWLIHVTLLGQVILILYLALFFGIFTFSIRSFSLLLIPSVWVLLEYVRSYLFTGFPWALLGYSQYKHLIIIQFADVTGIWGVSFLVMMVNVLIFMAIINHKKKLLNWARIFLVLFCLIIAVAYGFYKLQFTDNNLKKSKLKISLIQANIPQELKWEPQARKFIMDRYEELSLKAALARPDLIIWPEAASPGLLGEDEAVFKEIFSLGQRIKTPLLIGSVVRVIDKYYNSALLISSTGRILKRYDKIHLVPFGEFIPLRRFFPFLETIAPIGDIEKGDDFTIFEAPVFRKQERIQNKFAVLICFEDLFPELSREFVKRGASFLVNITNDGWYKKTSAAYQHLSASVFRAVENRVPLVRCANTGISAFISPKGEITSVIKDSQGRRIFIEGFDTQNISIEKMPLSFYARYPDIFILICFFLLIYCLIRALFKSIVKKILIAILIVLAVYFIAQFYFLDKCYFLCPIEYKQNIIIRNDSRGDGYFAANRRGKRIHQGVDLLAEIGTPVFASRLGVIKSAKENRGMGKFVVIQHSGGIYTIYGHLSKIYVVKNQLVRQNDIIGAVGKTGNANHPAMQPHLHFEVRKNGVPEDPLDYLD